MEEVGGEISAGERMLFEVIEHQIDVVEELVPKVTKKLRAFFFSSGKVEYQGIIGLLITIEMAFQAGVIHFRKSSMDKLRLIQFLYSIFSKINLADLRLVSDIDVDSFSLPKEEFAETINTFVARFHEFCSNNLGKEELSFLKELASSIVVFMDLANSIGGAEVFSPKPKPEDVARLLGVQIPIRCQIHPPSSNDNNNNNQ